MKKEKETFWPQRAKTGEANILPSAYKEKIKP